MKRKFLALSAVLALMAGAATAQNKTTFGVRAGVNFTNLNGEIGGNDLDLKMKAGFHVGVNAEIPLADEFFIQPGVLFSTKGAKADEGDGKINISYAEVPVNFLYKPEVGTGRLLLGVGPYLGIAVGGKFKGDGDDMDIEFTNDVENENEYLYSMKRLDFGGNLLFGYEFTNKFSVQLNAQLGMANLSPKFQGEKLDDTKMKNTSFGVSVGYRF
ncbi:porin family protein [Pseudobacter ginsenosidimutans]|uniref:Putative outer membrane protein n=1 Tax=Pseudobacter ginsenosidimutans TaxID=661488 RepID=A0A4Q7MKY6_9BACT|nr:porin family protein [Pseudobacter ginsenosidimutans]QEC40426.1 PorT family protein [Pseudobacter ginsenosidimutans]RZS68966.1 putative outer membrane protein [Pseudobacter ginsenosidimutans]